MRKPNVDGDSSGIGYRGDPSTNVVHRTGTGIGSEVVTGDGTVLEVIWAGLPTVVRDSPSSRAIARCVRPSTSTLCRTTCT